MPPPWNHERYTYTETDPATGQQRSWTWDIEAAKTVVRSLIGSDPNFRVYRFPPEELAGWLERNEWDPAHCYHVPDEQRDEPGICCQVESLEGLRTILIDGIHRAALKQLDGEPFYVYLLLLAEAKFCECQPFFGESGPALG
jgi:hypothetical protein